MAWVSSPMEGSPSNAATAMGSGQEGQRARPQGALVSAVSSGAWEMKAGDPTAFAFSIALSPNPHGTTDHATAEERESWGSFQIWAGGENLGAQLEQGEVLQPAHWYMLALMECLAD